jgi:hypothetical protein
MTDVCAHALPRFFICKKQFTEPPADFRLPDAPRCLSVAMFMNDLVVYHQAHARAITELEYSTGAKALFSASRDTTIVQWTPAGKKVQQFDGHEMAVTGIATHPADAIVASGARNGDVYACTIFLPGYPALGFSAYVYILSESTVKKFLCRLTS